MRLGNTLHSPVCYVGWYHLTCITSSKILPALCLICNYLLVRKSVSDAGQSIRIVLVDPKRGHRHLCSCCSFPSPQRGPNSILVPPGQKHLETRLSSSDRPHPNSREIAAGSWIAAVRPTYQTNKWKKKKNNTWDALFSKFFLGLQIPCVLTGVGGDRERDRGLSRHSTKPNTLVSILTTDWFSWALHTITVWNFLRLIVFKGSNPGNPK